MMKSMLRQSPLGQRSCVKLRTAWAFQKSVLMQIGAVNDGGMGNKGKSKTTRAEGKNKTKNKSSDT